MWLQPALLCSQLTAPRSLTQRPSSGLFPGSLSGSRSTESPVESAHFVPWNPTIPCSAVCGLPSFSFVYLDLLLSMPPSCSCERLGERERGGEGLLVGAPQCQAELTQSEQPPSQVSPPSPWAWPPPSNKIQISPLLTPLTGASPASSPVLGT